MSKTMSFQSALNGGDWYEYTGLSVFGACAQYWRSDPECSENKLKLITVLDGPGQPARGAN